MAGINDSKFIKRFNVGLAVLGGFNADRKTNEAALKAVSRGRREFVFSNPLKEIESEIVSALNFPGRIAVNVRASSLESYVKIAKICGEYDVILEVNAHCRQPEFLEIGAGQALLFDEERLTKIVEKCSKYCPVSVKVRGGLNLNYRKLAEAIFSSALFIHLDAMIPGSGADFDLVKLVSSYGNVIGNNSVKDINTARKMIESGAKLVSLARAVLENEKVFDELLRDEVLASPIEVV